jgi:hypothetical protein
MWWLGSLPWAYWPMSPVMSAETLSPVMMVSSSKRESSLARKGSSPPMASMRPRTSWGTNQECCQAFPSV